MGAWPGLREKTDGWEKAERKRVRKRERERERVCMGKREGERTNILLNLVVPSICTKV